MKQGEQTGRGTSRESKPEEVRGYTLSKFPLATSWLNLPSEVPPRGEQVLKYGSLR